MREVEKLRTQQPYWFCVLSSFNRKQRQLINLFFRLNDFCFSAYLRQKMQINSDILATCSYSMHSECWVPTRRSLFYCSVEPSHAVLHPTWNISKQPGKINV